jgi:hypothetical protein
VRLTDCDAGICGTVVWMNKAVNDVNNPDAAKRGRPVVGLQAVTLKPTGPGTYSGTLYDTESGKTYSGKAKLAAGGVELSGCVLWRAYLQNFVLAACQLAAASCSRCAGLRHNDLRQLSKMAAYLSAFRPSELRARRFAERLRVEIGSIVFSNNPLRWNIIVRYWPRSFAKQHQAFKLIDDAGLNFRSAGQGPLQRLRDKSNSGPLKRHN